MGKQGKETISPLKCLPRSVRGFLKRRKRFQWDVKIFISLSWSILTNIVSIGTVPGIGNERVTVDFDWRVIFPCERT